MNIKEAAQNTRASFEELRSNAIDLLEKAVDAVMKETEKEEIEIGDEQVFCDTFSNDDTTGYFKSFFYDDVEVAELVDNKVVKKKIRLMMVEVDDKEGNNYSSDISELTFDQAADLLDHMVLTYGLTLEKVSLT